MDKCSFDTGHSCKALGCFSSQKCNGRDKDGNPKYEDIEIKEEENK